MNVNADVWTRPLWSPSVPERPDAGVVGLWDVPRLALWHISHRRWTLPPLRIAVLADPHVNRPWLSPEVMRRIMAATLATAPDLILLPGDFLPDRYMPCRHLRAEAIIPDFAALQAPLGVWTVLGNHDYCDDPRARASDGAESAVRDALAAAGLPLLSNAAVPLQHGGAAFWLVGLDSQQGRGKDIAGYDDMAAGFAEVPPEAPVILLAHEPDCFPDADPRTILQVSGHTHGGQFVLFGRRPMTPSRYGDRYAIGHFAEGDRHLVVSAGLGYSGLPFRFGVPGEITLIELRSDDSVGGTP